MPYKIFANNLRDGDTVNLPSPFGADKPVMVKLTNFHKGGHFAYFYTQEFGVGKLPLDQEVELLAEEPQ